MRSLAILIIPFMLLGCTATRVAQVSTTTSVVVRDTTVNAAIPKDSASVVFTPIIENGAAIIGDSTKNHTIIRDTTISVKSSLSEAIFSIKNGRATLSVVDGRGKSDSLTVTVKGAVRVSNTSTTIVKEVRPTFLGKLWNGVKSWSQLMMAVLGIASILFLVYKLIPKRNG